MFCSLRVGLNLYINHLFILFWEIILCTRAELIVLYECLCTDHNTITNRGQFIFGIIPLY
jgi:hypothetical protein